MFDPWHPGRMPGGQDPRARQRGNLTARLGLDQMPHRTEHHPTGPASGPRHCWVEGCPELPPGRRAGLLQEWRRDDTGWAARVTVWLDGTQGPAVLTLWVLAEHLAPAGDAP
jgi:hypothetical protein